MRCTIWPIRIYTDEKFVRYSASIREESKRNEKDNEAGSTVATSLQEGNQRYRSVTFSSTIRQRGKQTQVITLKLKRNDYELRICFGTCGSVLLHL
ncbi:hypothetical protein HMPREF1989_02089 [Porphyromonas gingivalis F0566]|nr:hypothetical protein HMPREF1989_02089 [Porphyromonas gingivalis F0566]